MKRRSFGRKSGFRDSKLIIIATEGNVTEVEYFEIIKSRFRNSRVHVEILKRESTSSAPEYVITELDEFKKKYKLKQDDQLWMVIDFDRWGLKKLSEINQLRKQKDYYFVPSTPCFEIWLFLHLFDITEDNSSDLQRKKDIKKEHLKLQKDKYSVQDYNISFIAKFIQDGIARATELDIVSQDWLDTPGTKVYKLAQVLINED